jgi:hypothetical protein
MIYRLIREINFSTYKSLFFILILINPQVLKAQADSISNPISDKSKTTLSIDANLDIFYAYDFNKPTDGIRVPYMVSHNRHNEFNLNLGTIGAAVENEQYHANLVLQAGTYAIDNYVNENEVMRMVNEASAGIALTRNRKLWLDAGIFVSHIGFESPFQINDLTLTRSLMAENAPYFFTGAKLTYSFNSKWNILALITNSWQRIKRVEGSSAMSYGTMLQFTPSEKIQLNWSTFIGTVDPDSTLRLRYFNEIYALFFINDKWELQAGFDHGFQQKSKESSEYNPWFLASIITRYSFHEHWSASLRGEFVSDKYNVVIANPTPNEFVLWGISANLDYKPVKNVIARIEGRYWFSENQIFVKNDGYVSDDLFITFSLTIQFGKKFDL